MEIQSPLETAAYISGAIAAMIAVNDYIGLRCNKCARSGMVSKRNWNNTIANFAKGAVALVAGDAAGSVAGEAAKNVVGGVTAEALDRTLPSGDSTYRECPHCGAVKRDSVLGLGVFGYMLLLPSVCFTAWLFLMMFR